MISVLLILSIFFLSAATLQEFAGFFQQTFKNKKIAINLIAILYLPGTLVHEISHYIVALCLNMHPRDISFFPHDEGKSVRLGQVLFEKQKGDFIRPLLVGVAPLFGGLTVLWVLTKIHINIFLLWYLVWSLTANMFSSQQDLVDLVYIVPLLLLGGIIFFLFPNVRFPYGGVILGISIHFLDILEPVLLFSAATHAILLSLFVSLKRLR